MLCPKSKRVLELRMTEATVKGVGNMEFYSLSPELLAFSLTNEAGRNMCSNSYMAFRKLAN